MTIVTASAVPHGNMDATITGPDASKLITESQRGFAKTLPFGMDTKGAKSVPDASQELSDAERAHAQTLPTVPEGKGPTSASGLEKTIMNAGDDMPQTIMGGTDGLPQTIVPGGGTSATDTAAVSRTDHASSSRRGTTRAR